MGIRVLIDKLERKMKGTRVENTVKGLFEGKTVSYIKCKNIDYGSQRDEVFYDIQLSVRLESKREQNGDGGGFMMPTQGPPQQTTIYESFSEYVKTDNLTGDNKWQSDEHGLQDAVKG